VQPRPLGPGERAAIGGVLVFVEDGYLSSLEVYAFVDEAIYPLPPMDQLRLHQGPK
jgi:hypothetical protein